VASTPGEPCFGKSQIDGSLYPDPGIRDFIDPQFGSLFDTRQQVLDDSHLELMSAAIRERLPNAIA